MRVCTMFVRFHLLTDFVQVGGLPSQKHSQVGSGSVIPAAPSPARLAYLQRLAQAQLIAEGECQQRKDIENGLALPVSDRSH